MLPRFGRLQAAIDARRAEIRGDPLGITPEMVLVLETVGSVDNFLNAVRRTGLEWLLEWEIDGIEPDEDFYDEDDREKALSGQFYLVLTDRQALRQLELLWQRWLHDPVAPFERGLNRFRDVFAQLRDIRPWGVEDRVEATGILSDWADRIARSEDKVRFEVELWYRDSDAKRTRAQDTLVAAIAEADGRMISSVMLPDIAYHALLVELPADRVETFLQKSGDHIRLFHCDEVMHIRPLGQCSTVLAEDSELEEGEPRASEADAEPIVALLDGLPIASHDALRGRLVIDDPDDFESGYPARDRRHGTAMASLILNGDLDGDLGENKRPIYVRPILRPDLRLRDGPRPELIPDDILPIDIVYRSVRRLFEGDGDEPPVAPSVRIINLSIGDPARLFDRGISAWARLLDWLAWKYDILFIVSAGNHPRELGLAVGREELAGLPEDELQATVIRAFDADARNRRLLAPAESVNALTVGASHDDNCKSALPAGLIDPYIERGLPSPANALGLGYRRGIKPDLLAPGGRIAYREKLGTAHDSAVLEPVLGSAVPPGQRVAAPGSREGQVNGASYMRGTSNAAALVTGVASSVFEEVLVPLSETKIGEERLERRHEPVLLKAILAHTASWGNAGEVLGRILTDSGSTSEARDRIARLLGFGVVQPARAVACAAERITFVGWGSITRDIAHGFSVPLPECLSGTRAFRRVTVTLAWTAPIHPQNQKYRRVVLWADAADEGSPQRLLRVARTNAQWQTVRRGAIQHDVFEGESAADYAIDAAMRIRVNCRSEIDSYREAVPYALAVCLEVAEEERLPIYEQVRQGIRPAVAVRA